MPRGAQAKNRKKRRKSREREQARRREEGEEWDWFVHPGTEDDDEDYRREIREEVKNRGERM